MVRPDVSFVVSHGGSELSAPQGRPLIAGGESHLQTPTPTTTTTLPPLLLWRRSQGERVEGEDRVLLFSHTPHGP